MQALVTMSIADKRMSPQTENPSWNATVPRGMKLNGGSVVEPHELKEANSAGNAGQELEQNDPAHAGPYENWRIEGEHAGNGCRYAIHRQHSRDSSISRIEAGQVPESADQSLQCNEEDQRDLEVSGHPAHSASRYSLNKPRNPRAA